LDRSAEGLAIVSGELRSKHNLIGESSAFQSSIRAVERCARTDATVLIRGETGTGKELVARAVHYLSNRADYPFVPVNCGALPDSLLENELFGHRRGAFTGATDHCPGMLKLAEGGTLFLDEVDSLPLKAQVSLLRVLQDRRYRPLGGQTEQEANVRIVAASNSDLQDAIRRGAFRADLYYRLKLITVDLPPLREREGDAILLAEHFIRSCAKRYGASPKRLHSSSAAWFMRYRWPGNVRELENMIHSEFLLSDSDELCVPAPGDESLLGRFAGCVFNDGEELPAYAGAKARALEEFDRFYLTALLAHADGNITRASKLAGKERRALGKLIKRYNISVERGARS
jgi:two-component system response regulator GlrR